jgi:hypothetical protein
LDYFNILQSSDFVTSFTTLSAGLFANIFN